MGQRDQVLEDEVRYRYSSVIVHYRKSFIQENAQRYLTLFSLLLSGAFQHIFMNLAFPFSSFVVQNCRISLSIPIVVLAFILSFQC